MYLFLSLAEMLRSRDVESELGGTCQSQSLLLVLTKKALASICD
jgi:hypothetical protein